MTVGHVRTLSEVEKAWVAGVIDGEGSILITKINPKVGYRRRGFYYSARLEIANCNDIFLRRLLELIGRGSIANIKEKHPGWRDRCQYTGYSTVLREVLPQVLPYLIVKKKVAEKMLEYLEFIDENPRDGPLEVSEGFDERKDALYLEIKRLNERGPSSGRDSGESTSLPVREKPLGTGTRARNCRALSETEKAWLAAIIDGEGTIELVRRKDPKSRRGFIYVPTLLVSNTNMAVLVKVWDLIGEGGVYPAKKETNNWRKKWSYNGSAGVLRAILPQILPHLIVKRGQAKKMLEYFHYIDSYLIVGRKEPPPPEYYERLDLLYTEMRRLNKKGKGAGIA